MNFHEFAQKDLVKEDTPGKINMEPENTPLEKETHLPNHHFQVRAVNLRGCIPP